MCLFVLSIFEDICVVLNRGEEKYEDGQEPKKENREEIFKNNSNKSNLKRLKGEIFREIK